MKSSLERQQYFLRWTQICIWLLLCIAAVHIGMLHIFGVNSPYVSIISLIRPFSTIIAASILILSGLLWDQDMRRLGAYFIAVSLVSGAIFSLFKIAKNISIQDLYMRMLWVSIYLSAFIGAALHIKPRWWTKNNIMSILAGFTVSIAIFVVVRYVSFQLKSNWNAMTISWMMSLALDMGVLYSVIVVSLRYDNSNRSPIVILFCSFICLFIADVVNAILAWMPSINIFDNSNSPVYPLYSIHSILLVYSIHRFSLLRPSNLLEHKFDIPSKEWLLWRVVPQFAIISAFFIVNLHDALFFPLTILLFIVAAAHIILAERDHRRVLRDLAIAHATAQTAAQTSEAFIARLVHDLAPPVQGLTSVIAGSSWPAANHIDHEIAHRQLRFLESFIHQARTYLQARTVTLACTKVPLLPLCHTALSTIALRAQQCDIQIVQEIEVEWPMVWGDETAILRILDNLLTNALGVTPDGGAITLRLTAPTPTWVEVAIVDQGPGIPAERQALLFQPYHAIQPNTLTPSPTGTGLGLGLAIVRELTTALGGECGAESQPGVGSTFFVRLAREVPHYVTAEA